MPGPKKSLKLNRLVTKVLILKTGRNVHCLSLEIISRVIIIICQAICCVTDRQIVFAVESERKTTTTTTAATAATAAKTTAKKKKNKQQQKTQANKRGKQYPKSNQSKHVYFKIIIPFLISITIISISIIIIVIGDCILE